MRISAFRFPNEPCIGQASKNGTCYTADECSSKGGINSGTCAQGYGVCCTCKFQLNNISKVDQKVIESNFLPFKLLPIVGPNLPKTALILSHQEEKLVLADSPFVLVMTISVK